MPEPPDLRLFPDFWEKEKKKEEKRRAKVKGERIGKPGKPRPKKENEKHPPQD